MVVLWLGLLFLASVSKHNMWSSYGRTCGCCRPSVNAICGRIMVGLLFLASVSKHNMCSHYGWFVVVVVRMYAQCVEVIWLICCCCRPSVSTLCGRNKVGFFVVVIRQYTQYVDVLWMGCRSGVSTICGDIMVGFVVVVVQ